MQGRSHAFRCPRDDLLHFFFRATSFAAHPVCLSQSFQNLQLYQSSAAEFFFREAYQYLKKKKYGLAIETAQKGLDHEQSRYAKLYEADFYIIMGKSFLAQGQFALGVESLLAASRVSRGIDPVQNKVRLSFLDYFLQIHQPQLDACLLNYEIMISNYPKADHRYAFNIERGWLLFGAGQIPNSKAAFELVLNDFSSSYKDRLEAEHGLITIFIKLKMYDQALVKINDAKTFFRLVKNSSRLKILNSELRLYLFQKDFKKAEALIRDVADQFGKKFLMASQFQKIFEKSKSEARLTAILSRADYFRSENQIDRALAQYSQALQLNSISVLQKKTIQAAMAKLYFLAKKNKLALSIYQKLLAETSENDPAYSELFLDYSRLLLTDGLSREITENELIQNLLIIAKASQLESSILLSNFALRTFVKSYTTFDKKILSPNNNLIGAQSQFFRNPLFYHFYWGHYYLTNGRLKNARKEFSQIADEKSALGFAGLENVDTEENNYVEALNNYIKAKRLVGTKWFYFLQRPLVILEAKIQKQFDVRFLALLVSTVQTLMPEYGNVLHSILAHRYYNEGLLDESKQECLTSIALEKNAMAAHRDWPRLILALIAQKRNEIPEAERHYQSALTVDPMSLLAMTKTASFYQVTNRQEKAYALYQKVITVGNNSYLSGKEIDPVPLSALLAECYFESGNILIARGLKDKAILSFRKALDYGPTLSEKLARRRIAELTSLTK